MYLMQESPDQFEFVRNLAGTLGYEVRSSQYVVIAFALPLQVSMGVVSGNVS